MRASTSAIYIHAISFLVKYTKTLSVRNQHVRYSLSFFRDKRANSHTSTAPHHDSTAFTRIIAVPDACVDGVEFIAAAPRGKLPASKRTNCRLAYFNLPSASAGLALRKFRTAFRARAATALLLHTVFKFVAIMRHHATLCKQITSVLREKCGDEVRAAHLYTALSLLLLCFIAAANSAECLIQQG